MQLYKYFTLSLLFLGVTTLSSMTPEELKAFLQQQAEQSKNHAEKLEKMFEKQTEKIEKVIEKQNAIVDKINKRINRIPRRLLYSPGKLFALTGLASVGGYLFVTTYPEKSKEFMQKGLECIIGSFIMIEEKVTSWNTNAVEKNKNSKEDNDKIIKEIEENTKKNLLLMNNNSNNEQKVDNNAGNSGIEEKKEENQDQDKN